MKNRLHIVGMVLSFLVSFSLHSQKEYVKKHIYTFGFDYYYLDLHPDNKYSLKVGMYGNQIVNGDFSVSKDTLKLNHHQFNNFHLQIDNFDSLFIVNELSIFQILDSLLIPFGKFEDLHIPIDDDDSDSTIISSYLQTDGHAHYSIIFYSNSTFEYNTGASMYHKEIRGNWFRKDNLIELNPNDDEKSNTLDWITYDNKFILVNNYLIGKIFDKDSNNYNYRYLNKSH